MGQIFDLLLLAARRSAMFPNDICSWTPVALAEDLPPATVVPALTPGGAIALWRSRSGALSAAADRCPHRGMRLSHGFVRGEALSCIYHGWSYGRNGACLRIPAHPDLTPPDAIRVAQQRAEERAGVIWVTADETGDEPPVFDRYAPLRSLTFDIADEQHLAEIGHAAAAESGALSLSLAGAAVLLLCAAAEGGQLVVHALVDETADRAQRMAVSRALEGLRRAVEAADTRKSA